jgi:hypothetical protein
MRGLLYPKGNIIGGSGDRDGHCSWSAIVLPLTLTGRKLEHVPPLGTSLRACMFLYKIGSLGTVGFVPLGGREMTSCLQCQEHAWPFKPGIAKASCVMYDVWTSSPQSQTVHGAVSSDCYRTFLPVGVAPRSESAPLSQMSFFALDKEADGFKREHPAWDCLLYPIRCNSLFCCVVTDAVELCLPAEFIE